jgi:hypothetical protein
MIALDALRDFLTTCLWTGAVAGERPVSVIIVAPVGAGKTSTLETLQSESTIYLSDITTRELASALKEKPKARHILLSDLLNLFGHKSHVVKLTCRFLSSLTGESLHSDPFTGERMEPRTMGLISAIPPEDFARRGVQAHLQSGGFGSRFIIARYDYKPSTVQKIHRFIREDRYTLNHKPMKLDIPQDRIPIVIEDALAYEINELAMLLKKDALGTRIHHHLRSLVKAEARRAGRSKALRCDMERIAEFCDFVSPEGRLL